MKKLFALLSILTIFVIVLSGCGGNATVASWTTSGTLVNESEDNSWVLSVDRVNGHIRRDVNFTADNLSIFHTRSFISNGEMTLTMTQGSTEIVIDLTDGLDGFVNTSLFEPGNIRLRLDFHDATDVSLALRWQSGFFFQH